MIEEDVISPSQELLGIFQRYSLPRLFNLLQRERYPQSTKFHRIIFVLHAEAELIMMLGLELPNELA